jgi:hypothetical protein
LTDLGETWYRRSHLMPLWICECRSRRAIESRTLLKGVNELLHVMPIFVDRFR